VDDINRKEKIMQLNKIKLENFKCFKSEEIDFSGEDALIRAENGVGKTTIYDAWDWLLFGKDSDGRADFNVRPIDSNKEPIKGLVVAVEAGLEINGTSHTLRKEQHEKVVKGQLKGYEARCLIDEVPRKIGEYQEYITDLIPEEIFKMLTNLAYFNGKMHWTARRKVLIDIAGKIPKLAGFEELLANLNGRLLIDYEKVLSDRKKGYDKERKEINPRIDELQRGLFEYAQGDSTIELEAKRENIKEDIEVLGKERTELLGREDERQGHIEHINRLTVKRLYRESELKNQTGPVDDLLAERAKLERTHADKTLELVKIQNNITMTKRNIEGLQNSIDTKQLLLKSIREEYKQADSPNCSLCSQAWPKDKLKPGLSDIEARGNLAKEEIDFYKNDMAELQDKLNRLLAGENTKVEELKSAESAKNKRIAEINEAIKNRPEPDPTLDAEWQLLTKEIVKIQAEIGEPVTRQLDKIEALKKIAENELNQINESLAAADAIKKSKARITELEAREKELAQLIADCEKELDQIAQYKLQESKMVETAVNGRFNYVEYKLFEYYLNGEIKDICEAIYKPKGVPYPSLSTGQKLFCDIDTINILSDHYGVEVPLFVDDAADLTMPIKAESQVIRLIATFVYQCVACREFTYKQYVVKDESEIPEIIECESCTSNAKRFKELQIEVQKKTEKAVA